MSIDELLSDLQAAKKYGGDAQVFIKDADAG